MSFETWINNIRDQVFGVRSEIVHWLWIGFNDICHCHWSDFLQEIANKRFFAISSNHCGKINSAPGTQRLPNHQWQPSIDEKKPRNVIKMVHMNDIRFRILMLLLLIAFLFAWNWKYIIGRRLTMPSLNTVRFLCSKNPENCTTLNSPSVLLRDVYRF